MIDYIPTPTIGEILKEEFLTPLNISPATLAHELNISCQDVYSLLNGDLKISMALSKKLADFFNMSDTFFSDIQNDIDRRNLILKEKTA